VIPGNVGQRMSAWLERAWLQRYLARELDDDETAWFEAYVLDKPELLQTIESDCDLRDAVNAAANEPIPLAAPSETAPVRGRPFFGPIWSIAAVLVLGLAFGSLLRTGPTSDDAVIANPARIVYDTLRGQEIVPQFDPVGLESETWLVEVAVPATARNIRLELPGSVAIPLVASPDSFVSFVLPRARARTLGRAVVSFDAASGRVEMPVVFPAEP
jgi:hypothetical protein